MACILISPTPRLSVFKHLSVKVHFLDGMGYGFEIVANKIIISMFITINVHLSLKASYNKMTNICPA